MNAALGTPPAKAKTFDDLPDDVQASILREPENERAIRTQRALHYQELFGEQSHFGRGEHLERCQDARQAVQQAAGQEITGQG